MDLQLDPRYGGLKTDITYAPTANKTAVVGLPDLSTLPSIVATQDYPLSNIVTEALERSRAATYVLNETLPLGKTTCSSCEIRKTDPSSLMEEYKRKVKHYEPRWEIKHLPDLDANMSRVQSTDYWNEKNAAHKSAADELDRSKHQMAFIFNPGRHGHGKHNSNAVDYPDLSTEGFHQIVYAPQDTGLNERGYQDVERTRRTLQGNIAKGMSVPQSGHYYASPQRRAADTGMYVWSETSGDNDRWKVMEDLREEGHVNPCDKRLDLSALLSIYGRVADFEASMANSDADPFFQCLECRNSLAKSRSDQNGSIEFLSDDELKALRATVESHMVESHQKSALDEVETLAKNEYLRETEEEKDQRAARVIDLILDDIYSSDVELPVIAAAYHGRIGAAVAKHMYSRSSTGSKEALSKLQPGELRRMGFQATLREGATTAKPIFPSRDNISRNSALLGEAVGAYDKTLKNTLRSIAFEYMDVQDVDDDLGSDVSAASRQVRIR